MTKGAYFGAFTALALSAAMGAQGMKMYMNYQGEKLIEEMGWDVEVAPQPEMTAEEFASTQKSLNEEIASRCTIMNSATTSKSMLVYATEIVELARQNPSLLSRPNQTCRIMAASVVATTSAEDER